MWESIQHWLANNWLPIVAILALTWLSLNFGGMALSGIIRRSVRYREHGDTSEEDVKKRQDTLVGIFTAVFRVLIWLTAALTILQLFQVNIAALLAGVSIVGVAVGFGAQSIVKDFLSGLFIILENQYRVGDVVVLDGATGTVEQIGVRTTVVRDNNGSVHYIPNGTLNHVVNKTMGYAKVNLAIAVKSSTDIDKLSKIINDVGETLATDDKWVKKIIEAPHFSGLGEFNDAALQIKITAKTQPLAQWGVTSELRKRLLHALKKYDIELGK